MVKSEVLNSELSEKEISVPAIESIKGNLQNIGTSHLPTVQKQVAGFIERSVHPEVVKQLGILHAQIGNLINLDEKGPLIRSGITEISNLPEAKNSENYSEEKVA